MSDAARRRRCRRARPPPDGRRDLCPQSAARAAGARGGRGAAHRCGDAASRARPGRHRAVRARHLEPGAADGVVAAAAPGAGRRRLVHTQYALPLRCPCPGVVTIHDLSFERGAAHDGPPRPDRLPPHRAALGAPRRQGADRVRALAPRSRRALWAARVAIVVTPNGADPAFRPGDGGARDYVLSVGAVQPRKNQLAALAAAQEVGLPLVLVGPTKDPVDGRRAPRERRHAAWLRRDRGAGRPLPRRRLPRAGIALRGLRPAGARGDGERHAGRHRARRGAPRGRRRRRCHRRRGRSRRRHPLRARRITTSSPPRGWSGRACSPGARRPSARSRSTARRSADERLRRHRLPRACGRARALARRARCRRSTRSS